MSARSPPELGRRVGKRVRCRGPAGLVSGAEPLCRCEVSGAAACRSIGVAGFADPKAARPNPSRCQCDFQRVADQRGNGNAPLGSQQVEFLEHGSVDRKCRARHAGMITPVITHGSAAGPAESTLPGNKRAAQLAADGPCRRSSNCVVRPFERDNTGDRTCSRNRHREQHAPITTRAAHLAADGPCWRRSTFVVRRSLHFPEFAFDGPFLGIARSFATGFTREALGSWVAPGAVDGLADLRE